MDILPSSNPDVKVEIIQQPLQARMSGLGDVLSRRMIDPPLVIKILSPIPPPPTLVCLVSLLHSTLDQDLSFLCISQNTLKAKTMQIGADNNYIVPVLLGGRIREPQMVPSPQGGQEYLCIFPDLSVRIQGDFRLKVSVIDLQRGLSVDLYTKIFNIYSPQYYPGVLEPTALSRRLHGAGIPIKSGFHSNTLKRAGAKGILIDELENAKMRKVATSAANNRSKRRASTTSSNASQHTAEEDGREEDVKVEHVDVKVDVIEEEVADQH